MSIISHNWLRYITFDILILQRDWKPCYFNARRIGGNQHANLHILTRSNQTLLSLGRIHVSEAPGLSTCQFFYNSRQFRQVLLDHGTTNDHIQHFNYIKFIIFLFWFLCESTGILWLMLHVHHRKHTTACIPTYTHAPISLRERLQILSPVFMAMRYVFLSFWTCILNTWSSYCLQPDYRT